MMRYPSRRWSIMFWYASSSSFDIAEPRGKRIATSYYHTFSKCKMRRRGASCDLFGALCALLPPEPLLDPSILLAVEPEIIKRHQ